MQIRWEDSLCAHIPSAPITDIGEGKICFRSAALFELQTLLYESIALGKWALREVSSATGGDWRLKRDVLP